MRSTSHSVMNGFYNVDLQKNFHLRMGEFCRDLRVISLEINRKSTVWWVVYDDETSHTYSQHLPHANLLVAGPLLRQRAQLPYDVMAEN